MSVEIEKGRVGGAFDAFLREQGTYEETTERALKRVIAHQLAEAMKAKGFSKMRMAAEIKTSRSQLDRLLDPTATGVSLEALSRAALAVGRRLQIELV